MEKTKAQLYEEIFNLRSAQSECAVSERASLEAQITALFAQIRKLKEN